LLSGGTIDEQGFDKLSLTSGGLLMRLCGNDVLLFLNVSTKVIFQLLRLLHVTARNEAVCFMNWVLTVIVSAVYFVCFCNG
jgi:hypothetical protein